MDIKKLKKQRDDLESGIIFQMSRKRNDSIEKTIKLSMIEIATLDKEIDKLEREEKRNKY